MNWWIWIACVVFPLVVDASFRQCHTFCEDGPPSPSCDSQGPKGEKGDLTKSCNCSALEEVQIQLASTEDSLTDTNEELSKTKKELSGEIESLNASLATAKSQLAESIDELSKKPRSCRSVPASQRKDGSYIIQPNDSVQPFAVACSFKGGEVITSVDHNTEFEIEVKCNPHRCHRHEIQYQANIPQMRALIELVGNCRQFIKYRCHNSILLRSKDSYASWSSWNGKMKLYWGGGNGQPNYCACGIAGNCADKNYKCNCDKNDNVEREDSGYLSIEDDLPVHTLYFGDAADDKEYGFYTLGKLECMG